MLPPHSGYTLPSQKVSISELQRAHGRFSFPGSTESEVQGSKGPVDSPCVRKVEMGGGWWAGLWQEGGSSSPESSSKRVREGRGGGREHPEADLGGHTDRYTAQERQTHMKEKDKGANGEEEKEDKTQGQLQMDPENTSDGDSETERPALRERRQTGTGKHGDSKLFEIWKYLIQK